jgi:hypothetical protein
LYQIVGKILRPAKNKIYRFFQFKTGSFSWHLGECACTFGLVTFAWIFFRADSLSAAKGFLHQMVTEFDLKRILNEGMYNMDWQEMQGNVFVFSLLLLLLVSMIKHVRKQTIDAFLMEQTIVFRWICLLLLLFITIIYGQYGSRYDAAQFIYFQF